MAKNSMAQRLVVASLLAGAAMVLLANLVPSLGVFFWAGGLVLIVGAGVIAAIGYARQRAHHDGQ